MNLGRPRVLPDQEKNGVKVHRSVKMRMAANKLKSAEWTPYVPMANADWECEPIWED